MVESDGSEEAAEAVENLLESYFMQIDGTYDRLVSICNFPLLVLVALLHDHHYNLMASSTKLLPHFITDPCLAALLHDFHCKLMASSTKSIPYFITDLCLGSLVA